MTASQTNLAAQIIIQLTFTLTTGVNVKFRKRKIEHWIVLKFWDMCFCQPHTCLKSYKFLHQMVETFMHLFIMMPAIYKKEFLQNSNSEGTVYHISPDSKDNIIWIVLKEFGFSKSYMRKLLKGVDFRVKLEENGWVSYRVSDKWHFINTSSVPTFQDEDDKENYRLTLCHHTKRCLCKTKNQNLTWHHMTPH